MSVAEVLNELGGLATRHMLIARTSRVDVDAAVRCAKSSWSPVRPDLVDADLGPALEADSFTWHGDGAALRRDAKRYNAMVVNGWLVLRFGWEDVMFHPD